MIKHTSRHFRLVILAIFSIAMVGCRPTSFGSEGEIRFGISSSVAGYAVVGGEHYGFASDVANAVVGTMGYNLQIMPRITTDSILGGLKRGNIDIAVIPCSERLTLHDFPAESFYTTDYVLLAPSWRVSANNTHLGDLWQGKRIAIEHHQCDHPTCKDLAQRGAILDTSCTDCVEMARRVIGGKADGLICERSEAELLRFLYRPLREVATTQDECEVILVFKNRALKSLFTSHLAEFSATDTYSYLAELYFGDKSISERFTQLRYRPTRVVGGISVWDEQLRNIAKQVGVDWRLMSAMAYHESRFRNDQVSHKGAVGLMQVTPIVAEDLGLDEGYDLADPTTNIWLAARLLRRSSRALGFGDFPATDDQIAIVVASYNCGITRTLEAQRLVVAAGGSGDKWEDIKQMMTNMSNPEWIATSDYKMRRFGDAPTTIAYTDAVMALYNTYRGTIN